MQSLKGYVHVHMTKCSKYLMDKYFFVVVKSTSLFKAQTSQNYEDDNQYDNNINDNTRNDDDQPSTRNITSDTVIHSESINYDVLCVLAGTNNLGGVRNFTMRVRSFVFLCSFLI